MAYVLALDEQTVIPYLHDYPASRQGRLALFTRLLLLRTHAEVYMSDPVYRLAPGSPLFRYDYLLLDSDGDGRYHQFRFIVSDEGARYGVLRVVYVDVGS